MTTESLISYRAQCHMCAARCDAKNAKAWAHNHVRRNPGHRVELALGYLVASTPPAKAEKDLFK